MPTPRGYESIKDVRTIGNGRPAVVYMETWAGRGEFPAEVLGETAKRFKVVWLADATVKHPRGSISYVPKHAVRFT